MADFRRWFIALAVIALMAFAASAQVGVANGAGSNSAFACNATAAGSPQLRPEGFAELVGDIVISCTGGNNMQVGAAIPTTNITVYLFSVNALTSRYMNSAGASDALLIIDEAGSGIVTGAPGYGPQAPQTLCTNAQQQNPGGSSCPQFVGVSNTTPPYQIAVNAAPVFTGGVPSTGGTPAANVYQGKIGDFGANSVTFYAVPVMPPSTTGVSRTYRITNIRIPAAAPLPGLAQGQTVPAILSTNGPTTLPVSGTGIQVAVVGKPSAAAVKVSGNNPFQQCVGIPVTTPKVSANLIFTEGFATAFKTRVVPGGANNQIPIGQAGQVNAPQYAAEATNTQSGPYQNNQNIPGGLYGGFAQNSESGFIFPALTTSTSAGNYVAGLADYGTRLKAVFTNVPSGLTLFVSVTSTGTAPAVIGGTSLTPYAVLVSTGSGEANPDNSPTASFTPVAPTATGADGYGVIALSPNSSGAYTAVWEVTNSNPSATDTLTFNAYIAYTPQSTTGAVGSATYYGLPVTGVPPGTLPPNSLVNNVTLTLAPEPLGGTFTAATAAGPIPRFSTAPAVSGWFTEVSLCQTTLLYPFVTGASGFDTGIAVANTSADPWKTTNQTGSCTLYPYGLTVAPPSSVSGITPGTTVYSSTPISGCDQVSNPIAGTNCFPIVPAGQIQAVQASAVLPNFQGYVIAVCNFQFAHGYAALTDLGIHNIFSSYLALELDDPILGIGAWSRGTANGGVQGVEVLAH